MKRIIHAYKPPTSKNKNAFIYVKEKHHTEAKKDHLKKIKATHINTFTVNNDMLNILPILFSPSTDTFIYIDKEITILQNILLGKCMYEDEIVIYLSRMQLFWKRWRKIHNFESCFGIEEIDILDTIITIPESRASSIAFGGVLSIDKGIKSIKHFDSFGGSLTFKGCKYTHNKYITYRHISRSMLHGFEEPDFSKFLNHYMIIIGKSSINGWYNIRDRYYFFNKDFKKNNSLISLAEYTLLKHFQNEEIKKITSS